MNTVLVLDDDYAVRQSMVDFFEDNQWLTLSAASAEEALQILEENAPDAAIVDIRLPKMDGYDFIRLASKSNQTMVFVICTGSPEYYMPDDLKSLERLFQDIFHKPVPDLRVIEEELIKLMENLT